MRAVVKWALLAAYALTLAAGAATVVLAAGQPLGPGDRLYPAQHALTEAHAALLADPTALAERRLALLDERLDDLRERAASGHVAAAYREVEAALHAAVQSLAAAPKAEQPRLRARLARSALTLRGLLPGLARLGEADPALYASARVHATALLLLLEEPAASEDAAQDTATPSATHEGRAVPFPPNAKPGAHGGFALTGQHALAECAACHTEGRYRGTASQCAGCHAGAQPANHFAGACLECHSTAGWLPASLDHTGLTDCLSCHLPDQPQPHYDGQCGLCHGTESWAGARFDHSVIGAADCAACHAPPPNHFGGQCRACHTDTSNFRNASFSHTFPIHHEGANGNCSTCHPGANTFQYTCAVCHAPERMDDKHDDVAGFGANCVACHVDGREVDD